MAPRPKRSSDPVTAALREWNRLKSRHRRHPEEVTAEQVREARRKYSELAGKRRAHMEPEQPRPAPPPVATAAPPLAVGERVYTEPADAEYAGRLEVFLFLKLGLPLGEEWGIDEEEARAWLRDRPALYARVLHWFAGKALGDAFRTWFAQVEASEEAS